MFMKKQALLFCIIFLGNVLFLKAQNNLWPPTGKAGAGTMSPVEQFHITHDYSYQWAHLRLEEKDKSEDYRAWNIDNSAGNLQFLYGHNLNPAAIIFSQKMILNTDGKLGLGYNLGLTELNGYLTLKNNGGAWMSFKNGLSAGGSVVWTFGNAGVNQEKLNLNRYVNGIGEIPIISFNPYGRIGIGNDNPNYNLDVAGDINFTGQLLKNGVPFPSNYWSQNGNNIYNTNSGNVGIGTSTPLAKLTIENANMMSTWLSLKRGSYSWDFDDGPNGELSLVCKNGVWNYAFVISPNGFIETGIVGLRVNSNLGIGNYSPASPLSVEKNPGNQNWLVDLHNTQTDNAIYGMRLKFDTDSDPGANDNLFKIEGATKTYLCLNGNGYLGISNDNPQAQLDLSDIYSAGGMNLKIGNDAYLSDIDETHTLGIISLVNNNVGAIKLGLTGPNLYGESGNLGIGTTNITGYKLAVAGKIHAEEVKVEHADNWYDFVFNENYDLEDLYELEKFVMQNKHLPDVPAEKEVKENGINLGEMNGILLKKVEELTLYIIKQQKEIDYLKSKIE